MKIKSVEISGFKLFKDPVTFNLFDQTQITGSTYAGKTSIPEAIAFCLTGKSLNGESQIDDIRNMDDPKRDIVVTVSLIDEQSHTGRVVTRRRGKKDEIFIDGIKSTSGGLEAITGDPHLFLAIFNNRYFPGMLPSEKQRSMIETITGQSDFEAIFGEQADPDLLDKYQVQIYSPKEHQRFKTEIETAERILIELETESKILEKENLGSVSGVLQIVDGATEKELQQKWEDSQKVLDRQKDLLHKIQVSGSAKDQIYALETKLSSLPQVEEPKENMDEMTRLRDDQVAIIQQNIRTLQGQMLPLPEVKGIQAGECDLCGQPVTELYSFKYNSVIQEKFKQANENNIHIAQEINALESKLRQIDLAFTTKCKEIQNQASAFQNVRSQRSQIQNEIEFYRQSAFYPDEKDKQILAFDVTPIKEALEQVRTANQAAREGNREVERVQRRKDENLARISQITQMRAEIESRLSDLKTIYGIIKPSNLYVKAIQKKLDQISQYLDNTSIQLYRENKTTEGGKDVFEIYWKERPFRRLSNSESIICGLEISNMLNALTGLDIPIFIDNFESIAELPAHLIPKVQMLRAEMIKGSPLEVKQIS